MRFTKLARFAATAITGAAMIAAPTIAAAAQAPTPVTCQAGGPGCLLPIGSTAAPVAAPVAEPVAAEASRGGISFLLLGAGVLLVGIVALVLLNDDDDDNNAPVSP